MLTAFLSMGPNELELAIEKAMRAQPYEYCCGVRPATLVEVGAVGAVLVNAQLINLRVRCSKCWQTVSVTVEPPGDLGLRSIVGSKKMWAVFGKELADALKRLERDWRGMAKPDPVVKPERLTWEQLSEKLKNL